MAIFLDKELMYLVIFSFIVGISLAIVNGIEYVRVLGTQGYGYALISFVAGTIGGFIGGSIGLFIGRTLFKKKK